MKIPDRKAYRFGHLSINERKKVLQFLTHMEKCMMHGGFKNVFGLCTLTTNYKHLLNLKSMQYIDSAITRELDAYIQKHRLTDRPSSTDGSCVVFPFGGADVYTSEGLLGESWHNTDRVITTHKIISTIREDLTNGNK